MNKLLLIFILLSSLLIVGCEEIIDKNPIIENHDSRFQAIYSQCGGNFEYVSVIKDTQTGKEYLFVKQGYGAGMTNL